ncbi:3-hydroxyacyl-ACP dehydratase FabZ family protein [Streptomyces sp. NPDC054833]
MSVAFATPLKHTVDTLERRPSGALTRLTVGADEPVFRGHYPGFPIFPGVCLVETVHHAALANPPAEAAGLELVAVESVRFLSPVFPDDDVTVELEWKLKAGAWKAHAVLSTSRGRTAQVRLGYAPREAS